METGRCIVGTLGRVLLLCALALIAFRPAYSQETGPAEHSADWYEAEAKRAIEAENYESAIKLILEAEKKYPGAIKFNILLGDLYYDKDLYKLALEEYRKAEKKGDESFYTLNQISRALGKLNRNRESIDYLKRIIDMYPDSVQTYDDLGWMYFKTHQLKEGERILLEAIEKFGQNRAFAMTLGTIYSGLYDYKNSKKYYLEAIKDALKQRDNYFASIAYYNLSLLEQNFYHFNSALKYTNESIRMADRAPGHLAKGELFESSLDYRSALSEYIEALSKDTTPLSKVNLAILYQKFGKLKLAVKYIEDVLHSKDLSWMFYYGTDLERHYKDIFEILADSYEGLSHYERLIPSANIFQRIRNLFLSVKYAILGYYYRAKFRIYSVRVGKAYLKEKDFLDAYWEFYRANERYREVALKYLFLARDIEVKITPHSKAYYLQEEGKVRKSVALLKKSLSMFDPFWEREVMVESLRRMVPLLRGNDSIERRKAINRLYGLNRGALLQYGFGLPLQLGVAIGGGAGSASGSGAGGSASGSAADGGAGKTEGAGNEMSREVSRILRRSARLLKRMLRGAGSEVILGGTAGDVSDGFRYRLYILLRLSDSPGRAADRIGGAIVRLIDLEGNRILWELVWPGKDNSRVGEGSGRNAGSSSESNSAGTSEDSSTRNSRKGIRAKNNVLNSVLRGTFKAKIADLVSRIMDKMYDVE